MYNIVNYTGMQYNYKQIYKFTMINHSVSKLWVWILH